MDRPDRDEFLLTQQRRMRRLIGDHPTVSLPPTLDLMRPRDSVPVTELAAVLTSHGKEVVVLGDDGSSDQTGVGHAASVLEACRGLQR